MILGGDMTGKALVPIIDDGGGSLARDAARQPRGRSTARTRSSSSRQAVIRRGYYPFRTTPDELSELANDEPRWHALFEDRCSRPSSAGWRWPTSGSAARGIRVFVCPGNDDQLEVDEVVANAKTVELGEGRVIEINGFQLASSGLGEPHAVGHLPRGGRGRSCSSASSG